MLALVALLCGTAVVGTAPGTGGRRLPAVPCAMVMSTADASDGDEKGAVAAPAFCALGGLGRRCVGCGSWPVVANGNDKVCSNATGRWWQAALDWAAASATMTGSAAQEVLVSPGTIEVASSLPAWHPLGPTTGVHVPSGVSFGGLCPLQPTQILPQSAAGNSSERLWSLLLVAGARTGHPPAWPQPATNVTVHNLVLSGVSQEDVPVWRHCDAAESAKGAPSASVLPVSMLRVARGIFLPFAGPSCHCFTMIHWSPLMYWSHPLIQSVRGTAGAGVHVVNCTVLHMFGNGIETGVFDQWVAENASDAADPACHNGSRFCEGKVYGFRGTQTNPNTLVDNTICDCRFGGITVIGSNVQVSRNQISVSNKVWTNASQNHGTTMGVSAAFVGSHSVTVSDNTIAGGDCTPRRAAPRRATTR